MRYSDRTTAGRSLASALQGADPGAAASGLVLGVPRGGVIVAAALAAELGLRLDVALARKLGAPFNPELAVGALAEGGAMWINESLLRRIGAREDWLDEVIARESEELARRADLYRGGPPPDLAGELVIVVDDGVATGATLAAVLRALANARPRRLICAVPVAPPDSVAMLAGFCDLVVCPQQPRRFGAVGSFYVDFRQNSDAEVVAALAGAIRPDVGERGDR